MKNEMPLIHHVFFWLKNKQSREDLNKLVEGLNTLKKIGEVKLFKIGVPAQTPKRDVIDVSYQVSLMTMFESIEDHNVYQDHDIHLAFVENYKHLWEKVTVFDSMDI